MVVGETSAAPSVLLVDADEHFRAMVRLHLESQGLRVEEVASAEEAEPHATSSALVLVDLLTPDVDGVELRARLAARVPGVPVRVWSSQRRRPSYVVEKTLGSLDRVLADHGLDRSGQADPRR